MIRFACKGQSRMNDAGTQATLDKRHRQKTNTKIDTTINCLLTGGIALSIYVTSIVNKWIIFSKFNKKNLRLSIY
jgi:hypothetical protein